MWLFCCLVRNQICSPSACFPLWKGSSNVPSAQVMCKNVLISLSDKPLKQAWSMLHLKERDNIWRCTVTTTDQPLLNINENESQKINIVTLCKSNLTGHDIIFLHRSLFVDFLAALDSYFSPLNFFLCRHNLIFDLKLTNPRQWCCVTPHRTYDKSLRVTTTLMRGCWSGTEFGHYLVSSSMSLWQTNLFITIKRYTQWPNMPKQ